MSIGRRLSAILFIGCLCAASTGAQQSPDGTIPPAFRAGINFIAVDAIVTDKRGQAVSDLTVDDFEVSEDGKPQTIEVFRLVQSKLAAAPAPATQLRTRDDELLDSTRDDVRVFAILFDDYHVQRRNLPRVREALLSFLRAEVRPDDLLTVMYPIDSVRTLTFTRDYDAVEQVIRQFDGQKCDEDLPPGACPFLPRSGLEETLMRSSAGRGCLPCVRRQIVTDALSALAVRLGSLREGRKSIVYVSEGGLGGPLEMRQVYRDANRNNVSIYPVDPTRYKPGVNRHRWQDRLDELADETGGRAILDANRLVEGLSQMARDSTFYYLLGYNSKDAPVDGKFHSIKVRVKRSDMELRARKGYWAPTAEDVARAATPMRPLAEPVAVALATLARSEKSSSYVRTWLGTQRSENGQRVTLVWEPLAVTAGGDRRDPIGSVTVSATDARGTVVFNGTATRPAPVVFDAPPGKLEVRVLVQEAGSSETIDRDIRSIDVPEPTAEIALSTPRVFRARTARDYQALVADAAAVPVASRDFSRTERLLIRFDAYGNGGDEVQATAALLNRMGEKMSAVPVTVARAGGTHQIDLGLAALPAGDYLLEISVKSASGEAKELLAVRVGA